MRIECRTIVMAMHIKTIAGTEPGALTVYFDRACLLYAAEIACYRRQDKARAVRFLDASQDWTGLCWARISVKGKPCEILRSHFRR